jgi:hypothetical protein
MAVVTRTKQLCELVLDTTDRSPKKFRFTFSARLQNLALDAVEHVFRANEVFVRGRHDTERLAERRRHQDQALTSIKLLAYLGMLAQDRGAILGRQYERMAELATQCQRLLGGWINSDAQRWSREAAPA